jgi:hypothetical protein
MMMKNTNHKVLRINCIVDPPSPIESLFYLEKYNLLAVGRSDNSIEIWNTNTWVQLVKIFGTKSNSIRKVFMIKKKDTENLFDNLRLFSIGLNGYLIEWSLLAMEPKVRRYIFYIIFYLDILSKPWWWILGCRFKPG